MDPYKILLDSELNLVRVAVYGDFTQSLGEEIITRARTLASEHSCSILYDVRQATAQVDFSRWFYLPRELEVLRAKPTRNVKVAILVPAEQVDKYKFYETVATNVGLSVNVFLDEEKAIEWLR